jgi:5-dehydro-2-deoxygluconokinase
MLTPEAWQRACEAIRRNDANTRGIVILGLGESEERLVASFAVAATYPMVKGFAVGRTIFGDAAQAWMSGDMDDATAVTVMADTYARLCAAWDTARKG